MINKQLQRLYKNKAYVAALSKVWAFDRSLFEFETRRLHGCLSLVSVVCYQVEVPATDRSLVRRSPIEWCLTECNLAPPRRGLGPLGAKDVRRRQNQISKSRHNRIP